MSYDVAALRAQFPALDAGIAHFDGPGGTQAPRAVGEAIAATLNAPLSNRGEVGSSERNADDAVNEFRSAYADFLGASERGVVYGRSATQLSYDFSRHLAKGWKQGDEVVVSRLDHDSNVRPWIQAAERAGATVRWIEFDNDTAEINPASLDAAITDRTRLVAITAASNLLGTKPDVRGISDRAHAVGALVYVDGVHYAAHELVDIAALGADLFMCSPYKFLGPHCGVLAGAPELLETINPDKLSPSTNVVPERFEFGTLPYEIMAGATAAVDFLAGIAPGTATDRRAQLTASLHAIDEHETRMRERIEAGLAELGATVYSRAKDRTPTLLFALGEHDMQRAYQALADVDVLAPAGSFYAEEAFRALGLVDENAMRVGVAPYTNEDDVDRLLAGLQAFVASEK
ncbi:MAG: cysteine desulfurase-like protein [Pseudolysinimonas sp.]